MTMLVKRAPFSELDQLERSMRRMFGLGFAQAIPATDVYETKDEFVYELELPGFAEQDLVVEVSDHVLTVKGEHTEATEESEKAFHLHERLDRRFERQFALPPMVESEKLTASFSRGVLELHAPKTESVAPKTIPIATT